MVCKEMITELQNLIHIFQVADHAVEKLSLKVWETMGITKEIGYKMKLQLNLKSTIREKMPNK